MRQPRAEAEELPDLWATTSDAGRHAIAEAVFERIDVLNAVAVGTRRTSAGPARRVRTVGVVAETGDVI